MQKMRSRAINYIYFGCLFAIIAALHVIHVLLIEEAASKIFYILQAILQALFEVGILTFIATFIPLKLKKVFIVATFFLLFLHLVDFPLTRTMDISVWDGFKVVFNDSFENFLELLKAGNFTFQSFIFVAVAIALISFLGIFLYQISDRLSSKKPYALSWKTSAIFSFSMLSLLVLSDFGEGKEKLLKALPWKNTIFSARYPQLPLTGPLPQKHPESWYQKELDAVALQGAPKPNIYLFVAESIREDFITSETAPALTRFKSQEIACPTTVSGANATNQSWLSIFHSVYPFEWKNRMPKQWSSGALPLQLFKKAGYKIHVLSASRLAFYQMEHILFGKDHALADTFRVFAEEKEAPSYIYDTECINALTRSMQDKEDSNLFIVFLDGTHFDYSWPPEMTLPERPIAKTIHYLSLSYSKKNIEGIKNRYRHAIYHVDHLFNQFMQALSQHPKKDEAVIVFTADHGEEFFEGGRIFHASNLNKEQTRVPIYYRLPFQNAQTKLTSHLDIFPTLLDHVFGLQLDWFDGESILANTHKPYVLSTRYNANRNPYEFLITTEDDIYLMRFDNRTHIHQSKTIENISGKDLQLKLF